jgi:hypothetical protein
MHIAVADEASKKFCKDIIEYWSTKHEVRYENGASEHLVQWADLYFVEWSTNNIRYLYKFYQGIHEKSMYPENWDNNKKPIMVCRAIDWDVWIGWARDQELINWVDKWVCIAPHIEKKLRAEADFGDKLKLIRPGVNLERFPLKAKKTDGYQIGMVLGDMWVYKNVIGGLNIFAMLPNKFKLHIRGQHEPGEFNPVFFNHFLESRGLKDRVKLYPPMSDMNEFYEEIDMLLVPCLKESFNYGVGEAMAKGIRPVINNFYGAPDIWDKKYLFNNYTQAVNMIQELATDPMEYRDYIDKHYNIKRMMKEYDEWLGT